MTQMILKKKIKIFQQKSNKILRGVSPSICFVGDEMIAWHREIQKDKTKIVDFVRYFEIELDAAKKEVKIEGIIEKELSALPGVFEHRFSQLQAVEAVLEQLENEMRKLRSETFRFFLEKNNKALSSSDAWKYCDGDKDVAELAELINEVAYVRNQYLSITKSLDQKGYMIGHITRLRTAGLEASEIGNY